MKTAIKLPEYLESLTRAERKPLLQKIRGKMIYGDIRKVSEVLNLTYWKVQQVLRGDTYNLEFASDVIREVLKIQEARKQKEIEIKKLVDRF